MGKEVIKDVLEKAQVYLEGLCDKSVSPFESGFGYCLKKIAEFSGLNPEDYGTPNEDDND